MNRIASFDYLKLPLACLVFLLHASALDRAGTGDIFVLVNGLYRIAVPLFVMLSGFFFFSAFQKGRVSGWFRRVAIMYVFWMAVYFPFWIRGLDGDPLRLLNEIVTGYFHLWYVAGIMTAALATMLLLRLPALPCWTLTVLCAAAGVALQYAKFFEILTLPIDAFRNGLFFCLPFFMMGFEIAARHNAGKSFRMNYRALLAVSFAALFLESGLAHMLNPRATSFDILMSLYLVCPVVLLWCLSLGVKASKSEHAAALASLIYFTHIGFITIFIHFIPLTLPVFVPLTIALVCAGYAVAVRLGLSRYLKHIC